MKPTINRIDDSEELLLCNCPRGLGSPIACLTCVHSGGFEDFDGDRMPMFMHHHTDCDVILQPICNHPSLTEPEICGSCGGEGGVKKLVCCNRTYTMNNGNWFYSFRDSYHYGSYCGNCGKELNKIPCPECGKARSE